MISEKRKLELYELFFSGVVLYQEDFTYIEWEFLSDLAANYY